MKLKKIQFINNNGIVNPKFSGLAA